MNKQEFLQALQKGLQGLPQEEIDNALSYYEEYLEDAGEDVAKVIAELGKPSAIAAQIRADAALKGLKAEPTSAKKGISAAWLVLLAILASPIAFPVAIVIIAIFFSLFVTAAAMLFAFGLSAVICVVVGIGVGIINLTVLFTDLGSGIFGIGSGMISVGIGILLALLTIFFARWVFRAMAFLLNKLTTRKKGGA